MQTNGAPQKFARPPRVGAPLARGSDSCKAGSGKLRVKGRPTGIFDWLEGSDDNPRRAGMHVTRGFLLDREAMFDLARTATLERLLGVNRVAREGPWADALYDACWTASVELPRTPSLGPRRPPLPALQRSERGQI